jgi:hypothetical protein
MTQTPLENRKGTPGGTGTGATPEPKPVPPGSNLSPEDQETFREFQEIKKTTGFKKFKDSASEAIRLKHDLEEKQRQLEEKERLLSEAELKGLNPDYEFMTEEQKKEFRDKEDTKRRLQKLESKEKMREEFGQLPEEIKKKIEQHGGFEVFKDFCLLPENIGQKSMTNLARSFLFEEEPEPPAPGPKGPEQPKPGLEAGQGGGKADIPPQEPGTMTSEQAKELRTKNPRLYTQLVRDKKLKIKD